MNTETTMVVLWYLSLSIPVSSEVHVFGFEKTYEMTHKPCCTWHIVRNALCLDPASGHGGEALQKSMMMVVSVVMKVGKFMRQIRTSMHKSCNFVEVQLRISVFEKPPEHSNLLAGEHLHQCAKNKVHHVILLPANLESHLKVGQSSNIES